MPTLVLTIILTLLTSLAQALESQPLIVQPFHIPTAEGSPDTLMSAAQDEDGYLWFASLCSLSVYDGNLLRPALQDELRDTHINDMRITRGNVLWVATNTGVLEFSLITRKLKWHKESFVKPYHRAMTVYEDGRGCVWIGTRNGGLFRYEPSFDTFERIDLLPDTSTRQGTIFGIREGPDRNIWIATSSGLVRLAGNKRPGTVIPLDPGDHFSTITSQRTSPGAFVPQLPGTSYSVRELAFDGAGGLWVGIQNKGLWHYSARKQTLEPVPDVPASTISDLYTDASGDMWIATNTGLFRYTSRDRRFIRHPLQEHSTNAPQTFNIVSISETRAGDLWLGTNGQGAMRCNPHPAARIIQITFPENTHNTSALHFVTYNTQDSRLYATDRNGKLYRSEALCPDTLRRSTSIPLVLVANLPSDSGMTVSDDGSILFGAVNYLGRIRPGSNPEFIKIDPAPEFYNGIYTPGAIQPMPDGRIWFADKHSLFSWKPGEQYPQQELQFPFSAPKLASFDDTLLLGTDSTITAINSRTHVASPVHLLPEILEGNHIYSLHVDQRGQIWIAGDKRLYRYTPSSRVLFCVTTQSTHRQIGGVQSFWTDRQGNLWLQSPGAIYLVRKEASHAEMMVSADVVSGIAITSAPASLNDGSLIFGHSQGLLVLDTAQLASSRTYQALVSSIHIFGHPVKALNFGCMPKELELEHSRNYLSFTFSTPAVRSLQTPVFFYRLNGVDTDWNEVAAKTDTVSYAHLEPGSYTFQVAEKSTMETPASISITIFPPWWLTYWAKGGYITAGLLLIWGTAGLFSRLERARLRKNMLETLVMQDPLTGIPNRRKFTEVLQAERSRCIRSNHKIAVIMVDIDYFKGFNDRFGHQAGDEALRKVAAALSSSLKRPEDFVARYGGEEFVIILPATDRTGAERVAEKIQQAIQQAAIPYPDSPEGDLLTVSMGISIFSPQSELHIDSGLFTADQALYQAKRQGRNCIFFKDHCLSLTPMQ